MVDSGGTEITHVDLARGCAEFGEDCEGDEGAISCACSPIRIRERDHLTSMQDMRRAAQSTIDEVPSSFYGDKSSKAEESLLPTINRHNIFHTILKSPLPPSEKTSKRLGQEGFVTIAAGGETCARMMTNALYYILANQARVLPPLMAELKGVMSTPDVVPELRRLEQLQYLVRLLFPHALITLSFPSVLYSTPARPS